MKKSIYTAFVLLGLMTLITACEKENIDNEKPVIRLVSPVEDETILAGNSVSFEVEFSDNVALGSYKVDIHGALEDHPHDHATSKSRSASTLATDDDEAVEFIKIWMESEFISLGEEPISGKESVLVKHLLIEIPETINRNVNGEIKAMPLKEGHYHFIVYCTDEVGQESFISREIYISNGTHIHDSH